MFFLYIFFHCIDMTWKMLEKKENLENMKEKKVPIRVI